MNVYAIVASSLELATDLDAQSVFEALMWPSSVYSTVSGAMTALEREIAEHAQEQTGTIEGIQLPMTVEWKAKTNPVPAGTTITGRVWETVNPFTEETMQVHEMILQ